MERSHVSTIDSKAEEPPMRQSVAESWSGVPVDDRLQDLGSLCLAIADNNTSRDAGPVRVRDDFDDIGQET